MGGAFVGRVRELGELEHALTATRSGRGTAVLVAGEAGIGKTRLASEFAARAGDAGFEVLLGHSIDLVGTELPYQPFVEALRPLGPPPPVDGRPVGSQLAVFEETLALLTDRAAAAPVLLVLEDLHWADASTLDLVVFLAHNLDHRRVLLLATYRADEPSSSQRVRRLADGVMRSGSGFVLELGPLEPGELMALLAAQADTPLSAALSDAIVARAEGNPFFAEEVLAAAADRNVEVPRGLRDLLLQRVARLDRQTQSLLRLAAAAGRDVGYRLLRATAARPESDVRESLRQAVEHGVLVAEPASGTFRFRHALLAEAIYATSLPGEREELHAQIAEELARNATASPAELAPHWAAAGRAREALVASVEAAHQAEAVFGLAEALAHLERVLALWYAVPDAAELVRVELVDLLFWAAELASQTGKAPRAVELARGAIELQDDRHRAALLYVRLGEYLLEIGRNHDALAALRRAVEILPEQPPSPERAYALGSLAGGVMVAWRHAESLPTGEQALALARQVGAREAEVRALTVLGGDLAYLGHGEEGLTHFRQALRLAEEIDDRWGLDRAYTNLTDALTMLGRPVESARLAQTGLKVLRRYGIHSTLLIANTIEAQFVIGEWDEADTLSAAALRGNTANYPYVLLMLRADLEVGRGDFDAARAHFDAALATLREDRRLGIYDVSLAELALWERRWTDATRRWGTAWSWRAHPRPPNSACGSARRGCVLKRSWQRSPAPAATPTPSVPGSPGHAGSSRSLDTPQPRPQRSRRTPVAGSRLPRPSISAPGASSGPSHGRRQPRPGSGSSDRPLWRTVAGVRPRRSSSRVRPAPRRACRYERPMPSRLASEQRRCAASSSCLPNARGSISPHRKRSRPTNSSAWRTSSASRPARPRSSASPPAATPTARSPRPSSSASRRPASTSPTSCASSACRTGTRRPQSCTASPREVDQLDPSERPARFADQAPKNRRRSANIWPPRCGQAGRCQCG